MSKHTHGPWVVGPVDDTVVTHLGADGVRYEVAQIDGDYNEPDLWPVMEANARLIAAAPELLSALAPFVAFFEHALRGHTPDYEHRSDPDKVVCGWNGAQLTMRDFGNARAALAKAENG